MPKSKKMPKNSSQPKRRRTVFSVAAPVAAEVFLAGDFNGWDPRRHPMKKEADGLWKKTLMLFPGRYEYKFFVDGEWRMDDGREGRCWNCFGTLNSVIDVESPM